MKIEKRDGKMVRRILTGMVTDKAVLGRVANLWDGDMCDFKWANLVGDWCVDYYKRYGEAPGKDVEGLFETWAEGAQDKDTVSIVEKFLAGLSSEYENAEERPSADYVVDQAGEYFNRVRYTRLGENVLADIADGKTTRARERVEKFSRVELGMGAGIDLFIDEAEVRATFAKQAIDPLVIYPDALGRFFGPALVRDAFVSFIAPEKTGKSFWLLDIAWRAMLQRRKVAYFQVGDLSKDQIKERFLTRAARHPIRSEDGQWPCRVKVPTAIRYNKGDQIAAVDFDERSYDAWLDEEKAWQACHAVMRKKVKSKQSFFKLSCHENKSVNVAGIRTILEGWERTQDFLPDVVVVDYADILAPPNSHIREPRDQMDETWSQLRSLSQKLHCLLVTATQSDADAYNRWVMDRNNFSGDKRKLAHVTGMVGINVAGDEKDLGIQRLNWIVLRGGAFSAKRCVHVATCLALAHPSVCSTF